MTQKINIKQIAELSRAKTEAQLQAQIAEKEASDALQAKVRESAQIVRSVLNKMSLVDAAARNREAFAWLRFVEAQGAQFSLRGDAQRFISITLPDGREAFVHSAFLFGSSRDIASVTRRTVYKDYYRQALVRQHALQDSVDDDATLKQLEKDIQSTQRKADKEIKRLKDEAKEKSGNVVQLLEKANDEVAYFQRKFASRIKPTS